MKDINQSSRRRFIKAGGIFIAAYGVGAVVKAFAKEEEKENEEVSPAGGFDARTRRAQTHSAHLQ